MARIGWPGRFDVSSRTVLAVALVAAAVCMRLVPHPANFAPVTAVAIFGGAALPRKYAVAVPLLAMCLSDLLIGWYDYRVMLVVWGCYAATAFASGRWPKRPNVLGTAALTGSASLCFFLLTNFAVWAWGDMYPHTLSGLADCYVLALPFFRNTLLSDVVYTSVLFGLWALSSLAVRRFRSAYCRMKAREV